MPLYGPSGVVLGTQIPAAPTRAGVAGSSTSASPQDHAHRASGTCGPEDAGFLAWSFDAWLAGNNGQIGAGAALLTKVFLPVQASVSNVVIYVTNAGSGLSTCYAGLYTSAGLLVGVSADQTTAWSTTGLKTMALAGGPFSAGADFVWAALLAGAGSTLPRITMGWGYATGMVNGTLGVASSRAAQTGAGLTALPGSVTPSSLSQNSNPYWIALS